MDGAVLAETPWYRKYVWIMSCLFLGAGGISLLCEMTLGDSVVQTAGKDQLGVESLLVGTGSSMQQPCFHPLLQLGGKYGKLRPGLRPLNKHSSSFCNILVHQASGDTIRSLEDGFVESPNGGTLGPLAVLMLGYTRQEVESFRKMMDKELVGMTDMIQVIPGRDGMLQGTLRQALETGQTVFEQMHLDRRKTLILSGMHGEEASDLVYTYYEHSGLSKALPKAVVGAAMAKNIDMNLRDLVEELHTAQAAIDRQQWLRFAGFVPFLFVSGFLLTILVSNFLKS